MTLDHDIYSVYVSQLLTTSSDEHELDITQGWALAFPGPQVVAADRSASVSH